MTVNMRDVILDGKQIQNESDFHRVMSKSLGFGPHYGCNLDALWDRLSADVERPVNIIWLDSAFSMECLGECFDKIIEVFERTRQQDLEFKWDEKFDYVLK